jgi:hypothetical protein
MVTEQDVLDKLKNFFDISKQIAIEGGQLTIEEVGKQATLKQVNIVGVNSSDFALKFDQCGHANAFRADKNLPFRSACDTILFCQFQNDYYVLFFELKSSEWPSDYQNQLKSGHCFVDYLFSILKNFEALDCTNWKRRFFVFHLGKKTSIRKRPTHINQLYDKPEQPLMKVVDNNESIYLRKLLNLP